MTYVYIVYSIIKMIMVVFKVFPDGLMDDMASKKIFQTVLCPTQLFQ